MLDKLDTLIAFATVMLGISLLITIINQMIASLLGHRATYLKDGIKDLLETLDPNLKPHLEEIANAVMTHRLASDSVFCHQNWAPTRWKMASSIRPEELAKLLDRVATGQPYEANIQAILNEVNPTVARDAALIAKTVNAVAPGAVASADQLMKQLADKTKEAVGRLESGFNSTMDRVRQRFTLQMRVWTIIFSLTFALIYHLDAAKIYSQLATDPQLRASLADAAQTVMKQYENVSGCQTSTTPPSGGNNGGAQPPAQNPSSPDQTKGCDTKVLAGYYTQVRDQLSITQLALFKVPDPWWPKPFDWGMLFRILATAALLSLGAPFWYNALKSMVNLRSQVAEQQQKRAKS